MGSGICGVWSRTSTIRKRFSSFRCHEEPRHDGEVKCDVALVALPEAGDRVLRPLVGLCEQLPIRKPAADAGSQLAQELMGLGQVLAARSLPIEAKGNGVQSRTAVVLERGRIRTMGA